MLSLERGQKIPIELIDKSNAACNKVRRDALRALDLRDDQDPIIAEVGFAFYRDSLKNIGKLGSDYAEKQTRNLANEYSDGDVKIRERVKKIVDDTVKGFFRIKETKPVVVFENNN